MRRVGRDEAIELLERAVAEKGGDYKNPVCVLFEDDGPPCCLIGHALAYLGVGFEHHVSTFAGHYQSYDVRKAGIADLNDEATRVFEIAQGSADSDKTWGETLEYTKERLGCES